MFIVRRLVPVFVAIVLAVLPALAQTDGYFGQNKISYKKFDWKIYRAPHFDVHYYDAVEPQLQSLVSAMESAYLDVSRQLDHEVRERIPIILYATHSDFEQTNVILEELDEGIGAFAEPFSNRMVVPVDDPPDFRFALIKHELTHIFEYDILFGGSLRRTLRARPPLWLMEGLASYIGDDEDAFAQMIIRDGVVNNLVPPINQIPNGYLAYRYGHAVFDFIEQEYGKEGLRTFLFEFRKVLLANNLEKAFQDAFGLSIDQFDRRFARFLRQKYLPVLTGKRSPDEYGKEIGLTAPGRFTFSPTLSPSGELIAALATPGLELDVVILSPKDGKVIRNLTKGFTNRYASIVSEAFDGQRDLSWAPDGDRLAFFVRRENYRELMIYDPVGGGRVDSIKFKEIASCASPAFSPDGKWIAFSGNKDGVWDIFRINLETRELQNLTQDEYYDTNPTWSADGAQVLYNRRISRFAKIFTVEVGAPARKAALTTGPATDLMPAFSRDGKSIYFTSDRGQYGVYNVHALDLATGDITRLTDLTGGAFSPVEMTPADDGSAQLAYVAFQASTFRLYQMRTSGGEVDNAKKSGTAEPASSPLAPSRREAPSDSKPPNDAGSEEDLKPFEPPLTLTLDADKREPYQLKWILDAPDIAVGVTDDGTFLSNVSVNFSDMLGDQRVNIRSYSVSSFTNIDVSYWNLKRRIDWGARAFDYRDYYVSNSSSGFNDRFQRRQRFTSVGGFASYPLNRLYRIEGNLGYTQQRSARPFRTSIGSVQFDEFSSDFLSSGVDLVGDSTRWQSFGPFQGHRLRIGPSYNFKVSGDDYYESYGGVQVDYRGYQHMTRRSLLALRLSGAKQTSDSGRIFAIGGINQLRGSEFRDFFGTNYMLANFEIRFPLLSAVILPWGGVIAPIRGFAFVDAGTTWFDDQIFCTPNPFCLNGSTLERGKAIFDRRLGVFRKYETKDADGLYRDLHASGGLGVWLPLLGLPCNWSFSFDFDGKNRGAWHSNFYIVFDW